MSWDTGDLARVVIAPDKEFAGFTQGTIVQWNTGTFEHEIELAAGVTVEDQQVMSSVFDALTFKRGDNVMLARWKPDGNGTSAYTVLGRALTPGSGRAEEIIAWMRGQLAAAIYREVIGESFRVDNSGGGTVISSDWGDGNIGVGPQVQVDISNTGRALVMVSAALVNLIFEENGAGAADMDVEMSGANVHDLETDGRHAGIRLGNQDGLVDMATAVTTSNAVLLDNLNPGTTTFTCKYRATSQLQSYLADMVNLVVAVF